MGVFDFKEFVFRSNKVLPTEYDDALSYYEVLNKVALRLNDVTNATNALANSLVAPYDSTVQYNPGDYVWYNNALYKCTTANYGSFNPTDWGGEPVVFTTAVADDILSFEEYVQNIVDNQQSLIERTISGIAEAYDPTLAYMEGDYVSYLTETGAVIYKCISDTTAGIAPNDTDYWKAVVIVDELNQYITDLWEDFFNTYTRTWGIEDKFGDNSGQTINQKVLTEAFSSTVENVFTPEGRTSGYFQANGNFVSTTNYYHTFIPCEPGEVYYTNVSTTTLDVTFFKEVDGNKVYISGIKYKTHDKIVIPEEATFFSVPFQPYLCTTLIVSKQFVCNATVIDSQTSTTGFSNINFTKEVEYHIESNSTIAIGRYRNFLRFSITDPAITSETPSRWNAITFNLRKAVVYGLNFNLIVAVNKNKVIAYSLDSGNLYNIDLNASFTTLDTIPFDAGATGAAVKATVIYGESSVTIISLANSNVCKIDLSKYIFDGYKLTFGKAWLNNSGTAGSTRQNIIDCRSTVGEQISFSCNHWENKNWYAYGTSHTNINVEGKYANYVKSFSGLNLFNKGISGGGIGPASNRKIYDAITHFDDETSEYYTPGLAENADLITLETGANEGYDNSSFVMGDIGDTTDDTLIGSLYICLSYLQSHTNAQICLFASPTPRYAIFGSYMLKRYEYLEKAKQLCYILGVQFIDTSCCLGYPKLTSPSGSDYLLNDDVHQTNLGGYVYAQKVWEGLKQAVPMRTDLSGLA